MNKNIKILFLYPPEQVWPGKQVKPNGSLAYPYLAGALREINVESYIYDACVGNDNDNLDDFFNKPTPLPSGMIKTGVSNERILEIAKDYDAVGITSIFSSQETEVLRCAELIKNAFPDKLLFSGGVNARSRTSFFFNAGFDVIFTSESEVTIQKVAKILQKGSQDFTSVGKIIFKNIHGKIVNNSHFGDIIMDLDKLPMPAWDMLPNERYWKIARPHGGIINSGKDLKYASIMTSRGCPFACSYCHIAGETEDSSSGFIGKFRIKSDERVKEELNILKNDLGVKQIYIEDDSIFGRKRRGIRLLRNIVDLDLDLMGVNGINMVHLVKKSNKKGWLVPDEEIIELMHQVGFKFVHLPFESANPRILKKWCSNKLPLESFDPGNLIQTVKKYKINVGTNYMIGFPDETKEEIMTTVNFAKKMMKQYGSDTCHISIVMPVPGTPIFDHCIKSGQLPKDYNPDDFNPTKASMVNTIVPPEELERIRDAAWEDFNSEQFKNSRKSWTPTKKNVHSNDIVM